MKKGKSRTRQAARKARTQAKSYDKQAYDRTGYDGTNAEES